MTESTAPLKPEALEAAHIGYMQGMGATHTECLRAAITAYLAASPVPQEQGVKVRELEWQDSEPGHTNGHNGRRIVERARTPFLTYFIEHSQDDDTWWLVDGLIGPKLAGPCNEAWELRAAAQSDFEARILSALSIQEPASVAIREALHSCICLLEVMADNAKGRDDLVEWAMMSVMAKNSKEVLDAHS